MTDVADHQRADVEPHADAQRSPQFAANLAVQPVDGDIDIARRVERLPASGSLSVAGAEQCHQSVAQILVDRPSMAADGIADLREQAVENEHHVVGQALLADLGEPARIEEQHHQRALDTLRVRPVAVRPLSLVIGATRRVTVREPTGGSGRRGAHAAAP